mmetsp:Transcript_46735/g.109004  ORF Transcript_46735/g.109004 Transcript_46735/m.109004 type:complete len:81 (+) Transcript_46735:919-1161(+)
MQHLQQLQLVAGHWTFEKWNITDSVREAMVLAGVPIEGERQWGRASLKRSVASSPFPNAGLKKDSTEWRCCSCQPTPPGW